MDRSFLLGSAKHDEAFPGVEAGPQHRDAPEPDAARGGAVLLPGLRTGTDRETGKLFLRISVANAHGKAPRPFVLDAWMRHGEIGVALAEAAYATGGKASAVESNIKNLIPFLNWLDTEFSDSSPRLLSRLTSTALLRYRSHLDGLRDRDGKPLADNTKRIYLGKMRLALGWLAKGAPDRWGSKLPPNLRLPPGVWTGTSKRTVPRKALPADHLAAVAQAAAREVQQVMDRFEAAAALAREGRKRLHDGDLDKRAFADLGTALAAVDEWYGGYLRNFAQANELHPGLASAIEDVHGATNFFRHLYPGARELVPFVLLLTVHTAYNPETILGLQQHQVATNDLLPDQFGFDVPERHNSRAPVANGGGAGRVRIAATKARARGRAQHRSFRVDPDDTFGVYLLLKSLEEITSRIRPHAIAAHRDRVFLFHQIRHQTPVRSFGTGNRGACSDTTWTVALADFIEGNRLQPFTLASIRSTLADAVEQITGDIRSVQLLLGHTGADVTFQHYLSAGARRRAAEAIGAAQGARLRWAETGGRRDDREPAQGDSLRAVTAGFNCLDPYDSPMPGQAPGRLCSAWLACPFCPLAAVHGDDGLALARLIQLEDHVRRAAAIIPTDRYRAAYLPLLSKLAMWIEKFGPEARRAAMAVSYLKPLPELE